MTVYQVHTDRLWSLWQFAPSLPRKALQNSFAALSEMERYTYLGNYRKWLRTRIIQMPRLWSLWQFAPSLPKNNLQNSFATQMERYTYLRNYRKWLCTRIIQIGFEACDNSLRVFAQKNFAKFVCHTPISGKVYMFIYKLFFQVWKEA